MDLDIKGYVHRRKRKYMAQVLEAFEKNIDALIPDTPENRKKIEDFKALIRMRLNALAVDACDCLGGRTPNGVGQDLRDRLHPTGRP